MPKFILFIREDLRKYPIPEEQLAALISAHSNWARTLASQGKFIDGYGIAPEGMLVEKKNNQLIESPLRDTQEGIGGLYILDVADMQEAITIAKQCPTFDAGDIIEVRPLM
ncbi:MAG: YciI family protein [Bacteroidota bacterium]